MLCQVLHENELRGFLDKSVLLRIQNWAHWLSFIRTNILIRFMLYEARWDKRVSSHGFEPESPRTKAWCLTTWATSKSFQKGTLLFKAAVGEARHEFHQSQSSSTRSSSSFWNSKVVLNFFWRESWKKLLLFYFSTPAVKLLCLGWKTAAAGHWKCFLVLSALATIQSAHLYRNAAFIHLVTCQNCCLNKAKCYYYLSPSRLATRHFCPFTDYVFY